MTPTQGQGRCWASVRVWRVMPCATTVRPRRWTLLGLCDAMLTRCWLRGSFVTCAIVYQRWRHLLAEGINPERLIDFYRSHSNVLSRIAGSLNKRTTQTQRHRRNGLIERYCVGDIPLTAPISMLHRYFEDRLDAYSNEQVFFSPHPEGLLLRTAV